MKSSNFACCCRKLLPAGLVVSSFKVRCMRYMAAILLRVAGLDAFDLDAEPEPPHRHLAQPEERIGACEGNAVVRADGLGETELLEDGLEHREGIGFLGGGERLAGEERAAGGVGVGLRGAS